MKTITIPVTRRPDTIRRVIESLEQNENINEWVVYFGVEPASSETVNICENNTIPNKVIIRNPSILGCEKNPFNLHNIVFDNGSEFNTHLDDDVIVSKDALNLINWYIDNFKGNAEHKTFSLLNFNSNNNNPNKVVCSKRFYGLGFSCFRDDFYDIFKPNWFNYTYSQKHFRTGGCWDWAISGLICEFNLLHVIPEYSRCNHIGRVGTYCTEDFQRKVFDILNWNTTHIEQDFELDKSIIYDKRIYWE